ncbi:MAG: 50S ribosomal protein L34e [Acidilobaceae archaeon]
MVRPGLRVRSIRRVYRRAPSGRVVIHFEEKRPGKPICSNCGKPLGGVPKLKHVELRKLSKSKKRPNRPYGGTLCSTCLSRLITRAVLREAH